jgi:predicted nucleic acid-binding Zn ribbon protein
MKNKHTCICCNKPIAGRADKKFCNDHCRSEFNNQKKRILLPDYSINRINRILLQNRLILSQITGNQKEVRVDNEQLILNGFHFNFYTHTVRVKESLKYFCYDFGYMKKGNREVIIYKMA